MPWSNADIPDQSGRTAVVTGANGGLGLETAEALAGKGAHVIMAVRNQDKAADAKERILTTHPSASLELVSLDLANQASVKAATATIIADHRVVDLLVNNAGLMAMPERSTDDGYELQFGVNHLGHWTFTAGLLLSLLRSASDGRHPRVVTVTSVARFMGRAVDPTNPRRQGNYTAWGAYGQSKLANYYFGLGLQQAFEQTGVAAKSLIAHPGVSNTGMQARTVAERGGGILATVSERLAPTFAMRPDQGARMQLRAATDPSAAGGELYAPMLVSNGPARKRPILRKVGSHKKIDTLWTVSERETGVALDVAAVKASLEA